MQAMATVNGYLWDRRTGSRGRPEAIAVDLEGHSISPATGAMIQVVGPFDRPAEVLVVIPRENPEAAQHLDRIIAILAPQAREQILATVARAAEIIGGSPKVPFDETFPIAGGTVRIVQIWNIVTYSVRFAGGA